MSPLSICTGADRHHADKPRSYHSCAFDHGQRRVLEEKLPPALQPPWDAWGGIYEGKQGGGMRQEGGGGGVQGLADLQIAHGEKTDSVAPPQLKLTQRASGGQRKGCGELEGCARYRQTPPRHPSRNGSVEVVRGERRMLPLSPAEEEADET
ncbi:unnamed protein product [Pleuronectes platessa]|uniref:Uncharacterized protein n=1 Tax=Pleuronectes platessa TaxID=8262 RepID=A0A9N7UP09_PLEPL|nr:unnamed protein product [Pleuronectes platessa]